ncbi:hypothetical protein HAX54_008266, partial [Datura stramonium]|nr:hypothetical protein [Datura stramonium]
DGVNDRCKYRIQQGVGVESVVLLQPEEEHLVRSIVLRERKSGFLVRSLGCLR